MARKKMEAGNHDASGLVSTVTFAVCTVHYTNQALTVFPPGLSAADQQTYHNWIAADIVEPARAAAVVQLDAVLSEINEMDLNTGPRKDLMMARELFDVLLQE